MGHTRDWDSGVPIDHTKFKAIPGAIAALALDIEERLQAFFYGFTSGETSDGIKYLPFWVQTTAPTGAANKVCMYAEDSTSKAALKVKTEDDVEIQLTERTWGLLDDFALSNNTNLRARNAADDGFIDLLKVNASNKPEFSIIPELPASDPTTDNQASRKVYVDGKFPTSSISGVFGAWVDKSASYGAQQVTTDGFVLVVASETSSGTDIEIILYSDSNANPSTIRGHSKIRGQGDYGNLQYCNLLTPVKKNDYWKVTRAATPTTWAVYWIPLGN